MQSLCVQGRGVINDHPNCNADDEIAFEVSVNLEDLNFKLQGPQADLIYQPTTETEPQICTRKERRGVDVISIEQPCPDIEEEPVAAGLLIDLDAQLDFSVETQVCLSPDSRQSLGGTWSAALHQQNSVTIRNGELSLEKRGAEETANEFAYAYYLPSTPFMNAVKTDILLEAYSERPELRFPPFIHVDLSCLSFPIEALDNEAYHIGFSAMLLISSITPEFCREADCRTTHTWLEQSDDFMNCAN
jgi:hypothetical protein